jgi:hypothetical protein
MPDDVPTGLTEQYAEQWQGRWNAFLKREQMYAAPGDLRILLRDLREFLIPVIFPPDEPSHWTPGGPWATTAKAQNQSRISEFGERSRLKEPSNSLFD